MDLMQGLMTRRSVRSYRKGEKISKQELTDLLKAGMQAPSAMNKQPWAFVVVDKEDMLAQIQTVHPYAAFAAEAGTAIVVCANRRDCYEEYWKVDPMLAAQNILLAAHGMGLGACWCGVYPDATRMQTFAKMLNLPEHILPMALIIVGVPATPVGEPAGRYDSKKVHFNQWSD